MDDQIAGYRVVRRLGAGSSAEVLLGRGERQGQRASVALRIYPRAEGDAAHRMIGLLSTVEAPALPLLLDVGSSDGRVCLVVELLDGPTVAEWATARGAPHPGELTTVLAPVVATVAAAHAAGWSLGRLHASGLRLTARGRPVVASMRPERCEPSAPPVSQLEMLDQLVDSVHSLAGVERPHLSVRATSFADVERELFTSAAARPVLFDRGSRGLAVPSRVDVAGGERAHPMPEAAETPATGRTSGWSLTLPGADDLVAVLDRASTSRLRAGVVRWLRRHRRPAIMAAVMTAGAVAVVLALPPAPAAQESLSPASSSAIPATTEAAAPVITSTTPTTISPEPDASGTAAAQQILDDDPVAATIALLAERRRCLADRSVVCLEGVDQAGSPMADTDAQAVLQGTEPVTVSEHAEFALAERTGNAAVVTIAGSVPTQPASLLLMKGEAGWRVREVFD